MRLLFPVLQFVPLVCFDSDVLCYVPLIVFSVNSRSVVCSVVCSEFINGRITEQSEQNKVIRTNQNKANKKGKQNTRVQSEKDVNRGEMNLHITRNKNWH